MSALVHWLDLNDLTLFIAQVPVLVDVLGGPSMVINSTSIYWIYLSSNFMAFTEFFVFKYKS